MHYKMIAPGLTTIFRSCGRSFKLDQPMRAVHHSKAQYVVANSEEACLTKIRQRLYTSKKWIGFKVIGRE